MDFYRYWPTRLVLGPVVDFCWFGPFGVSLCEPAGFYCQWLPSLAVPPAAGAVLAALSLLAAAGPVVDVAACVKFPVYDPWLPSLALPLGAGSVLATLSPLPAVNPAVGAVAGGHCCWCLRTDCLLLVAVAQALLVVAVRHML